MEPETYGQKIARLRNERGETQEEAAKGAGVPKRTLQDVEADKSTRPQRATRLALDRYFNIEGDTESERETWSPDVKTYLDLMGAALEALPEHDREREMRVQWRDYLARHASRNHG